MLAIVRSAAILGVAAAVVISSVARAAPPPEPSATPPVVEDEVAADPPHFVLGAGGHLAFGTAPVTALGAHVSVELATRVWSLGLEGRYDLAAGKTATTQAGGAFVPCLRAQGTWACGVVLVSRAASEGAEISDARLVVGFGPRFELHLALPHDIALRFTGELLVHPVAYAIVENGHWLFKSPVLSMMLGPSLVHAF